VSEYAQAKPIVEAAASAVTGRKVWRAKKSVPPRPFG
jgi:hypothetical protein